MENDTLDSIAMTSTPTKDLDGAGGILTMGIISIPFCMGLIGLILAIITLTRSGKALSLYREYPHQYTEKSYKKVKAGRTCAIVSLSLLGATIILIFAIGGLA
ncbi:hypothetical protein [Fluviicola taffensis]|uniref:hypothetical protein n=1 Tax=Fluviicola taffensis TaxID=191579 RepID=UPI003137A37A